MRIGYFLSSEEYGPEALLEQAVAAEEAGFEGPDARRAGAGGEDGGVEHGAERGQQAGADDGDPDEESRLVGPVLPQLLLFSLAAQRHA